MSADVDLRYTDVEDSLRDSVRSLLRDRCPSDRVAGVYDGDREFGPKLWRDVGVDLGLAGLLVPEAYGGQGAGPREAAVVLEEFGRFATPVPFLTSGVVATTAALRSGAVKLTESLARGEVTAALAVPFSTGVTGGTATVRADGDGALRGRVTSVAGAIEADVLLVPVATGRGVELHTVATDAARVAAAVSLDMTRQLADVEFGGAGSVRIVGAEHGAAVVRDALGIGAALLASEQLGVSEWCLSSTVAYLKTRRQFGRAVGGFQAIKHRLADLWVEVESARAAARYAAATAAESHPDRLVAASLAKAYCSGAAVRAAEECVQLHGGIGMTWEHPAHLYLKRAKANQIGLGVPEAHRARLAELVDLPPPANPAT